jgi:subtilisin family serine protease
MYFLLLLSLLSVSFGVEISNKDSPYIPDEYIITYHENTTVEDAQSHWKLMDGFGVTFLHRYNTGFHKGFAAKITDQSVLDKLQNHPLVMDISVNGIVDAYQKTCTGSATALSWGLARTSYNGLITNGLPDNFKWDTGSYSGAGVYVYVIDTGILTTHQDFGGRAEWGATFCASDPTDRDGNGHGTHCTGTAIGTTYGIAKQARAVAVKVLGASGSGSFADVIAGIDFLTDDAKAKGRKALGSMSLGAAGTQAGITAAINNAVAEGFPVVVAAGNSNANACLYTPAGVASAISVAASEISGAAPDQYDSRSSFSNWGTCTHLFAPGRNIVSAWIGSNTATSILSGTSMACPHVAGQVACILSSGTYAPDAVKSLLQSTAQKDLIIDPRGSPNLLLYNECHSA